MTIFEQKAKPMSNVDQQKISFNWTTLIQVMALLGTLLSVYVKIEEKLTIVATQHVAIMDRLERLEELEKTMRTSRDMEKSIADLQDMMKSIVIYLGGTRASPPYRDKWSPK